MNKKLQDDVYDLLASIDEYFNCGSPVYPGSLNPFSVDDETLHMAVKRILTVMQKEAA